MKRLLFAVLVLVPFSAALAAPVTINDGYVGASPNNSGWYGNDVIGAENSFSISSMSVDVAGGGLVVNIFSTYFDNVGLYQTQLGDLLLSTTGWNPYGATPYSDDNASTSGTSWNYALVLSDHGEAGAATGTATNMLGQSGVLYLYAINNMAADLELTNAPGGYIYRANQYIQFNTGPNATPIAAGTWSISDVLGSEYDRLTFNMSLGSISGIGDSLALHWGMTCGNDIIEGSAAVPEPGTMALFGLGLLGAALKKRRA